MDIIKVTKERLKANLTECAFEINACLSRPEEKDCLDEFHKCVRNYALCSLQIQVLGTIESQASESGDISEGKD